MGNLCDASRAEQVSAAAWAPVTTWFALKRRCRQKCVGADAWQTATQSRNAAFLEAEFGSGGLVTPGTTRG